MQEENRCLKTYCIRWFAQEGTSDSVKPTCAQKINRVRVTRGSIIKLEGSSFLCKQKTGDVSFQQLEG